MYMKEILEQITELEGKAKAHKAKALSETAQARTFENKADELKAALLKFMQENGVTKDTVDMGIVNFIVSVNEGKESVDCPDIEAVPDLFCRIKKEPDKKAIAEHLLSNSVNWATIKKGEPYLTIKSSIK